MCRMIKSILLSQVILLLPAIVAMGANEAPRLVEEYRKEVPKQSAQMDAAKPRSIDDMKKDDATMEKPEPKEIPFYPKDMQKYNEMKEKAQKEGGERSSADSGATPIPLAPPGLRGINFDGVNQTTAGGLYPPDTHGAVGRTHFVQVTNTHVDIYRKSDQLLQGSVSLNAFFGYFEQTLFDPRCIYDHLWNRFIITAEGFPEADGDQWHFIGISQTSNALGAYWIYAINVGAIYGRDFWDFPQLGMTQDAIIITAHIFGNTVRSGMMTFAKARIYNGLGVTFNIWDGLWWNLTPPIVRDSDKWAALVCADAYAVNTGLYIYYLENAQNPAYAFLWGPYFIDTVDFFIPPNAPQPGTTHVLHTSDARFVNASTQIGYNLYQIHSVNFFGAACKWYQIDWWVGTALIDNTFWASTTSSDFNASIAANDFNDVYVTWSSTNASAGIRAQVRISGRRNFDPPAIGAGSALFTSPVSLTGNYDARFNAQRWGDYSAVTIDPSVANQLRAWIVNEKINAAAVWGSRIARIGF